MSSLVNGQHDLPRSCRFLRDPKIRSLDETAVRTSGWSTRLFMATTGYCDPRNFRTLPDKAKLKRLPKAIEGDCGVRN